MFAPLVAAPGESINQRITNIGYGWIAVMFAMMLEPYAMRQNLAI